MPLTEKLLRFQEKLDKGRIDWNFIFENVDIEEGADAASMLIRSGFVMPLDPEDVPPSDDDYWLVLDRHKEAVNPFFCEKRLYFSAPKYARSYANYLNKLDKRRAYNLVEFTE